jgi:lactoylglutathione lyase
MSQAIVQLALMVRDYDEAVRFYTEKLDFELLEDTDLGGGKRWVRVAPPGEGGAQLLLSRATTPEQAARVGNQTGDKVFLFIETDDFAHDHASMRAKGVQFIDAPRQESYGIVAVFLDLYGNKLDLIQRTNTTPAAP